jgi:carbon monoxide dehydrogenase subunit G
VQLDHEFTVPVPAEHAWPVLLDVERIGPCMPGATITSVDGKDFEGRVKVKVGPITVTYAGQASFVEVDDAQRRAVISAKGKEARGSGTANATITAQLYDQGESTRVTVRTDLAITGRPAQFGRGVMADVGGKLLERFADCLAGQLAGGEQEPAASATEPAVSELPVSPDAPATAPAAGPSAASAGANTAGANTAGANTAGANTAGANTAGANTATATATRPQPAPHQHDVIDLLEVGGGAIAKRLAPVAALLLLILFINALRRRRS